MYALIDTCHTLAVELHPGDIRFHESDDEPTGRIRIDARWNPDTTVVEFVGGPAHSTVMDVEGAPNETVMIPALTPTDETDPPVFTVKRIEYRMTGWSETDRHWIYSPA